MEFEPVLFIGLLSIILDNYLNYFHYSLTTLLIFINITAIYLIITELRKFLSKIKITFGFEYLPE
tara:strand:+ start:121 stop:315 length:195 start_codon:yes stop_codon:yes gene_type:complete